MVAPTANAASAQKPIFVGIDVGGTNIKLGLVDDAGQTLAYHSMRTEQDKGAEDACRRIGEAVRKMVQEAGIAAGDLAYKSLGPRTGVYTEPAMLEKAAHELADTEKMVTTTEKLYGPYRWGR